MGVDRSLARIDVRSTLPGDDEGKRQSRFLALVMPILKKLRPAAVAQVRHALPRPPQHADLLRAALQRQKEFYDAYVALQAATIGDRAASMVELASLETAPEKQGRGYATALVEALNAIVSLWRCAPFWPKC